MPRNLTLNAANRRRGRLEVMQQNEMWGKSPCTESCHDLCLGHHYQYVRIKYRDLDTGEIHAGTLSDRMAAHRKVDLDTVVFESDFVIPLSTYAPLARAAGPDIKRAPNPLPEGCFVSRPNPEHDEDDPNYEADHLLHEVKMWEQIRHHPHANLAVYLGCEVTRGPRGTGPERITGICFVKEEGGLADVVNPGALNKGMFREEGGYLGEKNLDRVVDGIESALKHLHGLGIAHRCVNPYSVVVGRRLRPWVGGEQKVYYEGILTDLGSACRIGARPKGIRGIGGTTAKEWGPEALELDLYEIADTSLDLDQLSEIETWLTGNTDVPWKFHTYATCDEEQERQRQERVKRERAQRDREREEGDQKPAPGRRNLEWRE